MKELPDFLSDEPSSASEATPTPEPVAQSEPQPTPETGQGQPRDETGKFAPKVTPAPETAPTPAPTPEPAHTVPLATLLEVRDKLSNTESELQRLREWRQQQEAQARAQPPVPIPDPNEDPVGYQQYQAEALQTQLFVERRDTSMMIAEMRHGAEAVQAAWKWGIERCDADPHFNAKVLASRNPAELVVSEWKRDQVASKVDPNEYEAYLAWKAAQQGQGPATAQPASIAAPTPAPAAPRPSLAAAPSAGASSSVEAVTGDERFARMFP